MKKELIDLYFLEIKYKDYKEVPREIALTRLGSKVQVEKIEVEEVYTFKKETIDELKMLIIEMKSKYGDKLISYTSFKQSYIKDPEIFNSKDGAKVNWDSSDFCIMKFKNMLKRHMYYLKPKKYGKKKNLKI